MREIDLWCSSCMVALEGREPVGVLLGAKRAEATLVHSLRVHPEHRRRGHGRHLLTSLGQKLAILGPPRLVAEVPADREPALALFAACHWREEARLVDWWREPEPPSPSRDAGTAARDEVAVAEISLVEATEGGLWSGGTRCWQRDLAALERRADELLGLGFHSPERLEACLVAGPGAGSGPPASHRVILAAGCVDSQVGRLGMRLLIGELARRAAGAALQLPRVAPGEIDGGLLAELGFRAGAEHRLLATEAKAA